MKQGQLLNRIVMLALLGAILLYLGVYIYQGFSDPLATALCYSYTVDDTVEATGYLARTERVLPRQTLIADVLPAEGEKVAKGETVAYLYRDAAALNRRTEMRALALRVEQLEYTMSRAGDRRDAAALTGEILDAVAKLRASVGRRELGGLPEKSLDLKSLIYKRDAAGGGADLNAIQAEIDELNLQLQALRSEARADTTEISADQAGVFSGVVDGYESLLTPERLETITPSELDGLAKEGSGGEGAVGKLITSARWYFVCTLTEAEAKRLEEGKRLKVRFSRDWSGEVAMEVDRIGEAEGGRVPVVLSASRYLSDTTLLRRQTVELVFDSVTGIRVPKEAVRVVTKTTTDQDTGETSQRTVTAVYAMVGVQAEEKPVTILEEGEDYFLVEPAPFSNPNSLTETKKALRPGDEIIVRADGLYDGKVVRTG